MPRYRQPKHGFTQLSVIDLETLLSNPLNKREHNSDEVRETVAQSLELGLPPLIVIDENNLVLSNYAGVQAAIELGFKKVFVSREVPAFSDAVKKRHLIEDGYSWVAHAISSKRPKAPTN